MVLSHEIYLIELQSSAVSLDDRIVKVFVLIIKKTKRACNFCFTRYLCFDRENIEEDDGGSYLPQLFELLQARVVLGGFFILFMCLCGGLLRAG